MPADLRFLADESVDGRIIRSLRVAGISVASVREDMPGLPDRDVLSVARRLQNVLVTEDHDFGEWVFAHGEPTLGVVFLRYRVDERQLMEKVLVSLVRRMGSELYHKFVTVTPLKIRVREI